MNKGVKCEVVIKQGLLSDQSIYLYSPYYLSNDKLYMNSSQLTNPLSLRSTNSILNIVLNVKAKRLTTELFDYNTRMFCFQDICNVPGPTLYCKPGDKLIIKLINDLIDTSFISLIGPLNGTYQYPNRTNIFIQGIVIYYLDLINLLT